MTIINSVPLTRKIIAGSNVTVNGGADASLETDVTIASTGGGGGGGNWWFNPPAASSFALASGDGTNAILTDDADAGLLFDFGAYTAADDNRLAYRTLSNAALDWDLIIAYNALLLDAAIGFGIGIMDSVSGRALTFLTRDTGYRFYNWTNLSSFSATYAGSFNPATFTGKYPLWLRVSRVSGNLLFRVSADGKQWYQIASVAISSFLVNNPNRVGIIGNYATTTLRGYANVEAFDLTGPAV